MVKADSIYADSPGLISSEDKENNGSWPLQLDRIDVQMGL